MYNNPGRCPQELLLFFHHLQYRHVLPSGKTLIQHIYDSHFSGVNQVELYIQQWKTLEGTLPKIFILKYCNVWLNNLLMLRHGAIR